MSQNYSIDQDLREAEAMAEGLPRYLRGSDLYASVTGGFFNFGNMPSLTVGALVMRIRRLKALRDQMAAEQQARLDKVIEQHDAAREEWRAPYETKVLREANSRLDTIQQYFQDVGQNTGAASGFGPEQLHRTIIQELLGVMDDLDLVSADLDKKQNFIDNRLDGIALDRSGFAWDSALEPVYPQNVYWWLYRQPRARR